MAKVIALRFDNIREVSALKTFIELGLKDLRVSPGDSKVGKEILEALAGCSKMFMERNLAEKDAIDD
tara:strand:- start:1646 stop:1846 length:201 start_codon:yes stop_codon:yes gene_type:complete